MQSRLTDVGGLLASAEGSAELGAPATECQSEEGLGASPRYIRTATSFPNLEPPVSLSLGVDTSMI